MTGVVPAMIFCEELWQSGKTDMKHVSIIALGLTVLIGFAASAEARGGGGHAHGAVESSEHGARSGGGRRHGNDSYMKAASQERDKLLSTKLKSICRGC
jgi:hypothetical protein